MPVIWRDCSGRFDHSRFRAEPRLVKAPGGVALRAILPASVAEIAQLLDSGLLFISALLIHSSLAVAVTVTPGLVSIVPLAP